MLDCRNFPGSAANLFSRGYAQAQAKAEFSFIPLDPSTCNRNSQRAFPRRSLDGVSDEKCIDGGRGRAVAQYTDGFRATRGRAWRTAFCPERSTRHAALGKG